MKSKHTPAKLNPIASAIAIVILSLPFASAQVPTNNAEFPLQLQPPTDRVQPIEPPFGLAWGESPDNVWKWANDNQFGTARGKMPDGRRVIEIIGPFPNAEFDRLRFYFSDQSLTEVELQFIQTGEEEDGVQFDAINKAMAIKARIDGNLGKGQLIKNEEGTDDDRTKWKFIQQVWTDEEHALWLAVFNSTSAKKEVLSLVSLHYRWETKINAANPEKKLDAQMKPTP